MSVRHDTITFPFKQLILWATYLVHYLLDTVTSILHALVFSLNLFSGPVK